jgi:hypothetical protein
MVTGRAHFAHAVLPFSTRHSLLLQRQENLKWTVRTSFANVDRPDAAV